MKTLVVEDSELFRLPLIRMLRESGHEVCSVTNGEEAIMLLMCDEKFDVVVTDFRMPQMGGLELAVTIRKLYGNRIKVIGMSASDQCSELFLQSGADGYVDKPVEKEQLFGLLENLSEELTWQNTIAH